MTIETNTSVTIADALKMAESKISADSDTPKLDAEILLCHVLKCNKTYLFTWSDKTINEADKQQFISLVESRIEGHPIAHLIGQREFWTLTLNVNPSTLIPRPDTETLVETVLEKATQLSAFPQLKGLDLGTGTGAIALALASELKHSDWLGLDFSEDAVALANSNLQLNNVTNCQFAQSDWYEFAKKQNRRFDVIVSNPPYIDPSDPHLREGDVRFEPLSALIADNHGLADIEHIISCAGQYLHQGGLLALEHGHDQGQAVQAIFSQYNFINVETLKDLGQNDRITIGYFN